MLNIKKKDITGVLCRKGWSIKLKRLMYKSYARNIMTYEVAAIRRLEST